jgi:predicted transcriptional regulator
MITPEFKKNAEGVLKWLQTQPKATQAGGGISSSDLATGSGLTQKDADEVINYLAKRGFITGANQFWLTPLGKMIHTIADE